MAGDPLGYSREIWKQFAELGWLALPIAESHGGLGGSAIETSILMEAFGRGLVSEPYLSTVVIGATLIERCASEAQKQALAARHRRRFAHAGLRTFGTRRAFRSRACRDIRKEDFRTAGGSTAPRSP